MSIQAAQTSVLDDSGDFQLGAGIAVAGAGATLLILGLIQNDKNEMIQELNTLNEETMETTIGIAPRRGGFSAGISVRW